MDSITDVGRMMPHLGGTSFRYDPLPGKLVTHRERLRFVYFDGKEQRYRAESRHLSNSKSEARVPA